MHKVKSMFLTLLCMGIILGIGYLVIMESGRKVLENGIMLEETGYGNTNSNIFYGKIEEDIELFPWNYYPGDEAEAGWSNDLGTHPMFQYGILTGTAETEEEELKALQGWYLCQLIAYKTDSEPSQVWNIFDQRQHYIMDEIRSVENSPIGALFFYQDNITLGKKQYQVRISFTQWNIISFVCIENREGETQEGSEGQPDSKESQEGNAGEPADEYQQGGSQQKVPAQSGGSLSQDRERWEEGKKNLVNILEESESQMAEYFDYMCFLRDRDDTEYYVDGKYANCYLESLQWLDRIQKGENIEDYELSNILNQIWEMQNIQDIYTDDLYKSEYDADNVWYEDSNGLTYNSEAVAEAVSEEVPYSIQVEPEVGSDASFSYQIVDLKDMILLLMQGEDTLGIFYDPIAQEFCGYNFFYEY